MCEKNNPKELEKIGLIKEKIINTSLLVEKYESLKLRLSDVAKTRDKYFKWLKQLSQEHKTLDDSFHNLEDSLREANSKIAKYQQLMEQRDLDVQRLEDLVGVYKVEREEYGPQKVDALKASLDKVIRLYLNAVTSNKKGSIPKWFTEKFQKEVNAFYLKTDLKLKKETRAYKSLTSPAYSQASVSSGDSGFTDFISNEALVAHGPLVDSKDFLIQHINDVEKEVECKQTDLNHYVIHVLDQTKTRELPVLSNSSVSEITDNNGQNILENYDIVYTLSDMASFHNNFLPDCSDNAEEKNCKEGEKDRKSDLDDIENQNVQITYTPLTTVGLGNQGNKVVSDNTSKTITNKQKEQVSKDSDGSSFISASAVSLNSTTAFGNEKVISSKPNEIISNVGLTRSSNKSLRGTLNSKRTKLTKLKAEKEVPNKKYNLRSRAQSMLIITKACTNKSQGESSDLSGSPIDSSPEASNVDKGKTLTTNNAVPKPSLFDVPTLNKQMIDDSTLPCLLVVEANNGEIEKSDSILNDNVNVSVSAVVNETVEIQGIVENDTNISKTPTLSEITIESGKNTQKNCAELMENTEEFKNNSANSVLENQQQRIWESINEKVDNNFFESAPEKMDSSQLAEQTSTAEPISGKEENVDHHQQMPNLLSVTSNSLAVVSQTNRVNCLLLEGDEEQNSDCTNFIENIPQISNNISQTIESYSSNVVSNHSNEPTTVSQVNGVNYGFSEPGEQRHSSCRNAVGTLPELSISPEKRNNREDSTSKRLNHPPEDIDNIDEKSVINEMGNNWDMNLAGTLQKCSGYCSSPKTSCMQYPEREESATEIIDENSVMNEKNCPQLLHASGKLFENIVKSPVRSECTSVELNHLSEKTKAQSVIENKIDSHTKTDDILIEGKSTFTTEPRIDLINTSDNTTCFQQTSELFGDISSTDSEAVGSERENFKIECNFQKENYFKATGLLAKGEEDSSSQLFNSSSDYDNDQIMSFLKEIATCKRNLITPIPEERNHKPRKTNAFVSNSKKDNCDKALFKPVISYDNLSLDVGKLKESEESSSIEIKKIYGNSYSPERVSTEKHLLTRTPTSELTKRDEKNNVNPSVKSSSPEMRMNIKDSLCENFSNVSKLTKKQLPLQKFLPTTDTDMKNIINYSEVVGMEIDNAHSKNESSMQPKKNFSKKPTSDSQSTSGNNCSKKTVTACVPLNDKELTNNSSMNAKESDILQSNKSNSSKQFCETDSDSSSGYSENDTYRSFSKGLSRNQLTTKSKQIDLFGSCSSLNSEVSSCNYLDYCLAPKQINSCPNKINENKPKSEKITEGLKTAEPSKKISNVAHFDISPKKKGRKVCNPIVPKTTKPSDSGLVKNNKKTAHKIIENENDDNIFREFAVEENHSGNQPLKSKSVFQHPTDFSLSSRKAVPSLLSNSKKSLWWAKSRSSKTDVMERKVPLVLNPRLMEYPHSEDQTSSNLPIQEDAIVSTKCEKVKTNRKVAKTFIYDALRDKKMCCIYNIQEMYKLLLQKGLKKKKVKRLHRPVRWKVENLVSPKISNNKENKNSISKIKKLPKKSLVSKAPASDVNQADEKIASDSTDDSYFLFGRKSPLISSTNSIKKQLTTHVHQKKLSFCGKRQLCSESDNTYVDKLPMCGIIKRMEYSLPKCLDSSQKNNDSEFAQDAHLNWNIKKSHGDVPENNFPSEEDCNSTSSRFKRHNYSTDRGTAKEDSVCSESLMPSPRITRITKSSSILKDTSLCSTTDYVPCDESSRCRITPTISDVFNQSKRDLSLNNDYSDICDSNNQQSSFYNNLLVTPITNPLNKPLRRCNASTDLCDNNSRVLTRRGKALRRCETLSNQEVSSPNHINYAKNTQASQDNSSGNISNERSNQFSPLNISHFTMLNNNSNRNSNINGELMSLPACKSPTFSSLKNANSSLDDNRSPPPHAITNVNQKIIKRKNLKTNSRTDRPQKKRRDLSPNLTDTKTSTEDFSPMSPEPEPRLSPASPKLWSWESQESEEENLVPVIQNSISVFQSYSRVLTNSPNSDEVRKITQAEWKNQENLRNPVPIIQNIPCVSKSSSDSDEDSKTIQGKNSLFLSLFGESSNISADRLNADKAGSCSELEENGESICSDKLIIVEDVAKSESCAHAEESDKNVLDSFVSCDNRSVLKRKMPADKPDLSESCFVSKKVRIEHSRKSSMLSERSSGASVKESISQIVRDEQTGKLQMESEEDRWERMRLIKLKKSVAVQNSNECHINTAIAIKEEYKTERVAIPSFNFYTPINDQPSENPVEDITVDNYCVKKESHNFLDDILKRMEPKPNVDCEAACIIKPSQWTGKHLQKTDKQRKSAKKGGRRKKKKGKKKIANRSQLSLPPIKFKRKNEEIARLTLDEFLKDKATTEEATAALAECNKTLENVPNEDIVNAIVQIILENVDEELISVYGRSAPPTTMTQLRLCALFSSCIRYKAMIPDMLKAIRKKILPDSFYWPDDSLESCSRFYSVLCNMSKKRAPAIFLCLDALVEMKQRGHLVVGAILYTWSELAPNVKFTQPFSLPATLAFLVMQVPKLQRKAQEQKRMKLRQYITKVLDYSFDMSKEDFTAGVLSKVLEGAGGTVEALSVLGKRFERKWTDQNIISPILKLLSSWKDQNVADEAAQRCLYVLNNIFESFATKNEDDKILVQSTLKQLSFIFCSKKAGQKIEEAIVEVILGSKRFFCRNDLENWVPEETMSPSLQSLLDTMKVSMHGKRGKRKRKLNLTKTNF